MKRVLVVGAGITGGVCRRALLEQGWEVEVWEKSSHVGGRFSTSKRNGVELDLGAQYITSSPTVHADLYKELLADDVIRPFEDTDVILGGRKKTESFLVKGGVGRIVDWLFRKDGDEGLVFGRRVVAMNVGNGGKWEVLGDDGEKGVYDAVISTIPAPQVLELEGDCKELFESVEELRHIEFSKRFAVGMVFEDDSIHSLLPFTASYISDDPVLRYVAVDSRKRGQDGKGVLVAHTSTTYGATRFDDDLEVVGSEVVDKVLSHYPSLPPPSTTIVHRWKYSQVLPSTSNHFPLSILLSSPHHAPLVLAGDSFSSSHFDSCVSSALDAVHKIAKA